MVWFLGSCRQHVGTVIAFLLELPTLMVEAGFKSSDYRLKHTQLHEHWVDQIVAGSWMTALQALNVDCLGGSSCYSRIIGDSNIS